MGFGEKGKEKGICSKFAVDTQHNSFFIKTKEILRKIFALFKTLEWD